MRVYETYYEVVLKQLPPSASQLRLLDVGEQLGRALAERRPDIVPVPASLVVEHWHYEPASFDAIVAYDHFPSKAFLRAALPLLREGGRLVLVLPYNKLSTAWGERLRQAGYVRLLVEHAQERQGVLIRGERAHQQADTLARVQVASQADADTLALADYRGRFVHVLVRQTPNKPAWRLAPDEVLEWHCAALDESPKRILAFTSLPKAVAFMQSAVLANVIRDVNKVAKFRKELVQEWQMPVLLNPTLAQVQAQAVLWLWLDPSQAEAPDE